MIGYWKFNASLLDVKDFMDQLMLNPDGTDWFFGEGISGGVVSKVGCRQQRQVSFTNSI